MKNLKISIFNVFIYTSIIFIICLFIDEDNFQDNNKELKGKIIKVYDGDTINILENDSEHRIRLYGIDSPELKQSFGYEARDNLQKFCQLENEATIIIKDKDKYGRIVGEVYCDGINANLQQLSDGYAWAYTDFFAMEDPSKELKYILEEQEAREKKLGLWAEENPTNPSDFRHKAFKKHYAK